MNSLLTTFAESKNTVFLLLLLKESINKISASIRDFMLFFFVIFLFQFEKIQSGRARKSKNQVGQAIFNLNSF